MLRFVILLSLFIGLVIGCWVLLGLLGGCCWCFWFTFAGLVVLIVGFVWVLLFVNIVDLRASFVAYNGWCYCIILYFV